MINSIRSLSTGRTFARANPPAVPARKQFNAFRNVLFSKVSDTTRRLIHFLGGKPTIVALEIGVIIAGLLFASSYGWLAVSQYSFYLMFAGAIILLAAIGFGFRGMMRTAPNRALYNRKDNTYLALMTREEMDARYAAFMQMVFWIGCGIIPFLGGAIIQSFL